LVTTQIFEDITKSIYDQKPSNRYNSRKFILDQKPITLPNIDTIFKNSPIQ